MRRAIKPGIFNRHGFRLFKTTPTLSIQQKQLKCTLSCRFKAQKNRMNKLLLCLLALSFSCFASAQNEPDAVLMDNIGSIKFYQAGNQTGYPVIALNSGEQLELHFDDLDGKVKSYSYTFQLCNADWTQAVLSTFDYIKGFSQTRITQYRPSSIAFQKYIHYQAILPDKNAVPTKSGNYLLKVFLDGDANKVAFTRRMMVVDKKADIAAQILQPFNGQLFRTHQKVQFTVSKLLVNAVTPTQQIKAVILQNNRWDNAAKNIQPTFVRGTSLEFNSESDCVFPAGKEFRWADLRSLRFRTERIAKIESEPKSTSIFLQPDVERLSQRINFRDYNGAYFIENTDADNPWWQGDYATVHFTFVPTGNAAIAGKKIFVVGEMNNYNQHDSSAMVFNEDKGVYEKSLFLKQGYYSYTYVAKDVNDKKQVPLNDNRGGDLWETENDYTILVYYRPLAGRHDELIGYTTINSLNRRGF